MSLYSKDEIEEMKRKRDELRKERGLKASETIQPSTSNKWGIPTPEELKQYYKKQGIEHKTCSDEELKRRMDESDFG